MPLAYLYSRYPVVSQTFCDSEMLALEQMGQPLVIGSLNPPPNSFRHERLRHLQAEILYPPPAPVLKSLPIPPEMAALAAEHEARYSASFKAATRARNAAWFAREFHKHGVRHIHVHFANRATHTALFLKKAGFTFSFTAHAQDYMVDLGSAELLRELAREAEFVIAVSDFSRNDLRQRCPDSAEKIHRIYNGLRPADFAGLAEERAASASAAPRPLRIVSIGRLIEFKGFHHLIDAVALLGLKGVDARLEIIGDGPWRTWLANHIESQALGSRVTLAGTLSQEQIKRRLAESDVFALACCVDGKGASDILPTVIMEAMAAQLPVISTTVAGVPEMVVPGETGLLAPPNDPPSLADALAGLARDPARRHAMGAAGLRKCERDFSLVHTAGELLRRFQPLLAAPPALDENANASATFPTPRGGFLILSEAADEPELPRLVSALSQPSAPASAVEPATVLAATGAAAPPWLEFLPDAIVLEAAWRAQADDAALCEALYAKLSPADGEGFFRAARRAVHTAALVRKRGVRHLHAARSGGVLWAWLVKKLTGVRASFAIEPHPSLPRSLLAEIVPDFDIGSIADEKLSERIKHTFPDVLGLAPPKKRGLFSKIPAAAPQPEAFAKALRTLQTK